MSATIIGPDRLNALRARKGLVTYSWRHCVACSRQFRSTNSAQCVCAICRWRARQNKWEFGK